MEEVENGNILNPDRILASAVNYLIQGQELYEASILLLSDINITLYEGPHGEEVVYIELKGNRIIYEIINDKANKTTKAIERAFRAILPYGYYLHNIRSTVVYPSFDEKWRENHFSKLSKVKDHLIKVSLFKKSLDMNGKGFISVRLLRLP